MTLPKISIVIRCFNEEKHISKLLAGIVKQNYLNKEIIVVDSGSTDDTIKIAETFGVKIVNISPDEFSFGRALNRGCAAASGEYLVFASAHVYPVYDDWLEKLVQPFENPKISCVYGKQRGNHLTKFSEHQIFAKWFGEKSIENQSHPFANNANCAIRKSVWEKFKYNEELTGLEDIEFAKRILNNGSQLCYVSEAEIIHVHEETPEKIFNRYHREAIALKAIFPNESMSFFTFCKLFIFNAISDCLHAFQKGVLFKNIMDIFKFRYLQFLGAYKGLKDLRSLTSDLKRTMYYPLGVNLESKSAEHRSEKAKIEYGDAQ